MCIVFISSIQHVTDGYRLIIASNRDEYYSRPTLAANFWSENQNIIGGRDLEQSSVGGTWLALNISGRLAILLNVFELHNRPDAVSRGRLVENFVKYKISAPEFMRELQDVYNGFKLITISISELFLETHIITNRMENECPAIEHLPNCVRGFGNGPYLKVAEGEKRFNDIVKKYGHSDTKSVLVKELLRLLKWKYQHYPDEELIKRNPNHLGNQKQYSSVFVEIPELHYGTRTHTIILIDHDGKIEYNEWTKSNSNWEHQCFTSTLKCEA